MNQPSLDLGDTNAEFSLIGNDHQTRLEAEQWVNMTAKENAAVCPCGNVGCRTYFEGRRYCSVKHAHEYGSKVLPAGFATVLQDEGEGVRLSITSPDGNHHEEPIKGFTKVWDFIRGGWILRHTDGRVYTEE